MRVQPTKRRVGLSIATLLGVVALTAALVSAASAGPSEKAATAAKGGTYRVGWESTFGWTDSFDPTGRVPRELIRDQHESSAPQRSSATTTSRVPPATSLVPDLATTMPKPTNGGKRYTFQLKNGIKFGPPVNREITSKDVKYAIERLARPKNGAQYGFYFNVIKGLGRVRQGRVEVDLRHQDAEREDDRLQPRRARRATSPSAWACRRRDRSRKRSRSASRASRVRTVATSSRRART